MRDTIVGVVLLVLAGLYWREADAIAVTGFGGAISAQGLPKLLAGGLAVTSILLILQSLGTRRSAPASQDPEEQERRGLSNHGRAAGIVALGAGYILLVDIAGYVLAVLMLLLSVPLYMGARPGWTLVGVATGGAAVFWIIFAEVLNIPLPKGILPL